MASDKTILVTGGFGYVGSQLTPHLLSKGLRVRVLDLCLYGTAGLDALKADPNWPQWSSRLEFIQGDIRDPDTVAKALKDVNTVIHLAAISNDPTGDIDEVLTRQVNFDAVGPLLAIAKKSGCRRFINASSSSVFGIKREPNVVESLEPEPLTHYSRYKMLSEWIVLAASSEDFVTVNVRPATICGYSPRQRFDLTVNKLTVDAIKKRVITVHGGQQRRPNVGITDMVHLYEKLVDADARAINGATFNFGFENLKVIEIAQVIQHELKDLGVAINVTSTTDNRDYHISSEKMLKLLGYQPVSSIRQEVGNLRRSFDAGRFEDVDDARYYNMKMMKLTRNAAPYQYLAR